jgi:hypothetical protein
MNDGEILRDPMAAHRGRFRKVEKKTPMDDRSNG